MNAMLLIDRCDYIRNRTYRHSFTARAEVYQILLNHKRDCQEINNVELVRAFFCIHICLHNTKCLFV